VIKHDPKGLEFKDMEYKRESRNIVIWHKERKHIKCVASVMTLGDTMVILRKGSNGLSPKISFIPSEVV
jgi:hypothetical protein